MREVLFRIRDNGHWYYGLPLRISENNVQFSGIDENGADVYSMFNEKETLGEYIGLCDKNGKKIFEGDIICHDFCGERRNCVVMYGNFNCSCCDGVYGWYFDGYGDIRYIEDTSAVVIGNIYDSPELLEK